MVDEAPVSARAARCPNILVPTRTLVLPLLMAVFAVYMCVRAHAWVREWIWTPSVPETGLDLTRLLHYSPSHLSLPLSPAHPTTGPSSPIFRHTHLFQNHLTCPSTAQARPRRYPTPALSAKPRTLARVKQTLSSEWLPSADAHGAHIQHTFWRLQTHADAYGIRHQCIRDQCSCSGGAPGRTHMPTL